jgi:hypothetical protein
MTLSEHGDDLRQPGVFHAMLRFRILPVLFLALFAATSMAADNKPGRKVRLGGVMVNAGYSRGPAWYPYYGYGGYPGWGRWAFYDPIFYSPFLHPGLYTGFGYGPNMGEVKLAGVDKEASVYLDGGYAGPASKLKSMWLEPGVYNLEVRSTACDKFERRIYVLTGKTLQVRAQFQPPVEAQK